MAILLPTSLFGQLLSNDLDITTTEYYKEIELQNVKSNIIIKNGNFLISFSKENILKVIDTLLLNNSLTETYHAQLKKSAEYLRSVDSIYITDYYQFKPNGYNLDDSFELTKYLILELACPLLKSGKLNIINDGKTQLRIFKSTGYFGGASAPTYWSENWRPIWICPPITND